MEKLARSSGSVYLFGAKPGVAEAAAKTLIQAYPGLRICGTHDGYFSDDGPILTDIRESRPDLVLVCLGAPKQELWMAENVSKLNVRLMAGLGGSLDVFAGNVKRAPKAWQRLGLEWLYRLIKEPRRIKRMIKLPLFVLAVIMKRIRG
jgi:N-acetylglucosaminyldiphosphoundecaprenol N-acetyl-beta-D-mannosaminyltransferase